MIKDWRAEPASFYSLCVSSSRLCQLSSSKTNVGGSGGRRKAISTMQVDTAKNKSETGLHGDTSLFYRRRRRINSSYKNKEQKDLIGKKNKSDHSKV